MANIFKNLIKLTLALLMLGLFLLYANSALRMRSCELKKVLAQNSTDAIAIRIIPNPDHYSALRWYTEQGFSGSPQSLIIDGYEAVRDGRTVYVNAANVDLVNNELYTNIYLLSYNQAAETATISIVNQLLQHWHFNTDLQNIGQCVDAAGNLSDVCLIDPECPIGKYCNSNKAKVARDTRRLADLADTRIYLEDYHKEYNYYPKLASGSYLPSHSLSVWPSWQQTLAQELGISLPIDPINQLGECEGYDEITCWDEQTKEFATNLNIPELPSKSRMYFYYTESQFDYTLCAQMETHYNNIEFFNCVEDILSNTFPIISGVNLVGWPKQEFIGYAMASDSDGDSLIWSVSLSNPGSSGEWIDNYSWVWEDGYDNFTIKNTVLPSQKEIHAEKAGLASVPGIYQIEITVDDGHGGVTSEIFDITINSHLMTLSNNEATIIIGQAITLSLAGTDGSINPLTQLYFDSATINSTIINTEAELNSHGFTIAGMDLIEVFAANQQTGNYIINAYSQNPITSLTIDSFFNVTVENHPPAFNSFTATYHNGIDEICNLPSGCSFTIDNGEDATVKVSASDVDSGHTVSYSLVNAPAGLSINGNTGEISGLENLNFYEPNEATFNIQVKASDQYCANSQDVECSLISSFSITVKAWCSVETTDPGYVNASHYQTINEFELSPSNEVITTDLMAALFFPAANSCSKIGNGVADITAGGASKNKAIVFVVDTSGSMDGQFLPIQPDPGDRPIDHAKIAIKDTIDELYNKAFSLPPGIWIDVGLIRFSSSLSSEALDDITNIAHRDTLKNTINGFAAVAGTHTLNALNKAETMLLGSSADDKIVILLSDGVPTDAKSSCSCGCYSNCCTWCGCPCPPENIDPCSSCSPGGGGGGGGATFNDKHNFTIATTIQTQCLDTGSSCSCTAECPNTFSSCSVNWDCSILGNTNTQAEALKDLGFDVYTIYYDTGGTSNVANMCNWSSDISCPAGGTYAFSGTDIGGLFDSVIEGIFARPENVKLNGSIFVPFVDLNAIEETLEDWNGINSLLSCTNSNIELFSTYDSTGSVILKDVEFDYCDPLLHP